MRKRSYKLFINSDVATRRSKSKVQGTPSEHGLACCELCKRPSPAHRFGYCQLDLDLGRRQQRIVNQAVMHGAHEARGVVSLRATGQVT